MNDKNTIRQLLKSKLWWLGIAVSSVLASAYFYLTIGNYPSKIPNVPAWALAPTIVIVIAVIIPIILLPIESARGAIYPEPKKKDELFKSIDHTADTYIKNGFYFCVLAFYLYLSLTNSSVEISSSSSIFHFFVFFALVGEVLIKKQILRRILSN